MKRKVATLGVTRCYVCRTQLIVAKELGVMVCPNPACEKYVARETTS